jgi:hypothetical protein
VSVYLPACRGSIVRPLINSSLSIESHGSNIQLQTMLKEETTLDAKAQLMLYNR